MIRRPPTSTRTYSLFPYTTSRPISQIATTCGTDFLLRGGELDRRRLRAHVFGNAEALRALEAITHPQIRAAIRRWLAAQTGPYCMLSVAILEIGRASCRERVGQSV